MATEANTVRAVPLWPARRRDTRGALEGTDYTAKRAALGQALDALKAAAKTLAHHIEKTDRRLPAIVFPTNGGTLQGAEARAEAARILQKFVYESKEHGPGRKSEKAPGAIAASDVTLAAAAELNHAKEAFKIALTKIPARQQREALAKFKAARLHIRQAGRTLYTLGAGASHVGFYWTTKTADYLPIERSEATGRRRAASPDWVDATLNDAKEWNPAAKADLDKLRRASDQDELLVVRAGTPCVMAVARYLAEDAPPRQVKCYTFLPVLVAGQDLPALTPLADPGSRAPRRRRGDASVEPFLATMPVFRRRRQAVR